MKRLVLGSVVAALSACGDSGGAGTLALSASGGNEARSGISTTSFADGYSATFEHAYLAVSDVSLRATGGVDAEIGFVPTVVDLVSDPKLVLEAPDLEARRYDDVTYVVGPPDSASNVRSSLPSEIVERIVNERLGVLLIGTITPPAGATDGEGNMLAPLPFELGFPVRATYARCGSGDGTLGVVVPNNSRAEAEISWHLAHAFFDSYAEEASLRAEAIYAAWDGEGPLVMSDLATQRLSNLKGADGRALDDTQGYPVVYLPGASGALTLEEFVLAARFGHFGGLEGECTTTLVRLDVEN